MTLGNAVAMFMRQSGGKLPERLSALHAQGHVLDLATFVCPASGKTVATPEEIDEKTDFAIAASIGKERPILLLWEKEARHEGGALQFMSNRTFRRDPGAKPGSGEERAPGRRYDGATSRPPTGATIVANEWTLKGREGVSAATIAGGALVLEVKRGRGAEAWRKQPCAGDFDLEVDYDLQHAASERLYSGGLGVRMMAAAGNPGVMLDRRREIGRNVEDGTDVSHETVDAETTAHGIPTPISATTSGRSGSLRVRRRGDRFEMSFKAAGAAEWTKLGDVDASLGVELKVGIVAYGLGPGGVTATITRTLFTTPK
jgi:hypothetical protein